MTGTANGKPRRQRTRPPLEERTWLSPKDVGDLAGGISAQYVREEIDAKRLKAMVIPPRSEDGRCRYRIHRDDARAFAEQFDVARSTGNNLAT